MADFLAESPVRPNTSIPLLKRISDDGSGAEPKPKAAEGGYHLIKTISPSSAPGGDGYYDYIRVDAVARRVYVSRGTEGVVLSVVGKMDGLSRSHVIATAGAAQALATSYDFTRDHKVIDIGGGTGSFLVSILTRHSRLAVVASRKVHCG